MNRPSWLDHREDVAGIPGADQDPRLGGQGDRVDVEWRVASLLHQLEQRGEGTEWLRQTQVQESFGCSILHGKKK